MDILRQLVVDMLHFLTKLFDIAYLVCKVDKMPEGDLLTVVTATHTHLCTASPLWLHCCKMKDILLWLIKSKTER